MIGSGAAPLPLESHFFGHVKRRIDLDSEKGCQVIDNHFLPDMTNRGRWLEDAEVQMSLMQQFAINTAFQSLANGGLYSINRPLGADRESPGSAFWAASRRNLLNIALTRCETAYLRGWATGNYGVSRSTSTSLRPG